MSEKVETEPVNGVYVPRRVYKYRCDKCGAVWNGYDDEKMCRKCRKRLFHRLSEVIGGRVDE